MKNIKEVTGTPGVYGIYYDDLLLYIGSSNDTNRRKGEHIRKLRAGKHTNKTLQKYIEQHEIDLNDLSFKLLHQTKSDKEMTLRIAEMILINNLRPLCNKPVISKGRSMIVFPYDDRFNLEILKYL